MSVIAVAVINACASGSNEGGDGVNVCVGVFVGVSVGVLVGVSVGVLVDVFIAYTETVYRNAIVNKADEVCSDFYEIVKLIKDND